MPSETTSVLRRILNLTPPRKTTASFTNETIAHQKSQPTRTGSFLFHFLFTKRFHFKSEGHLKSAPVIWHAALLVLGQRVNTPFEVKVPVELQDMNGAITVIHNGA